LPAIGPNDAIYSEEDAALGKDRLAKGANLGVSQEARLKYGKAALSKQILLMNSSGVDPTDH